MQNQLIFRQSGEIQATATVLPNLKDIKLPKFELAGKIFVDEVCTTGKGANWSKPNAIDIVIFDDDSQIQHVVRLSDFSCENSLINTRDLLNKELEAILNQSDLGLRLEALDTALETIKSIPFTGYGYTEDPNKTTRFELEFINMAGPISNEQMSLDSIVLEHVLKPDSRFDKNIVAKRIPPEIARKGKDNTKWFDIHLTDGIENFDDADLLRLAKELKLLDKSVNEDEVHFVTIPFMLFKKPGENESLEQANVAALLIEDTLITFRDNNIPEFDALKDQVFQRERGGKFGKAPGSLLLSLACSNMSKVKKFIARNARAHREFYSAFKDEKRRTQEALQANSKGNSNSPDQALTNDKIRLYDAKLDTFQDPMHKLEEAETSFSLALRRLQKIKDDTHRLFDGSKQLPEEELDRWENRITKDAAKLSGRINTMDRDLAAAATMLNTDEVNRNSRMLAVQRQKGDNFNEGIMVLGTSIGLDQIIMAYATLYPKWSTFCLATAAAVLAFGAFYLYNKINQIVEFGTIPSTSNN